MHPGAGLSRNSSTSVVTVPRKGLTPCHCLGIIAHPSMAEIGGSRWGERICCVGLLLLIYQVFIQSFHCDKLLFNLVVKNHSKYISWKVDQINDGLQ